MFDVRDDVPEAPGLPFPPCRSSPTTFESLVLTRVALSVWHTASPSHAFLYGFSSFLPSFLCFALYPSLSINVSVSTTTTSVKRVCKKISSKDLIDFHCVRFSFFWFVSCFLDLLILVALLSLLRFLACSLCLKGVPIRCKWVCWYLSRFRFFFFWCEQRKMASQNSSVNQSASQG